MAYGANAPFGLAPTKNLNGANWNSQTSQYLVTVTNNQVGTGLYTGDPVEMLGTGFIQQFPSFTGTTSVLPILGVFQGCSYTDPTGTVQYASFIPLNTQIMPGTFVVADVIDDPNVIFQIQGDNTAAITNYQGLIGGTFYIVNPGASANLGNNLLGTSQFQLTTGSAQIAANVNVKILRVAPTVNFNATLPYYVFEVIINNHFYRTGNVGI